MHRLVFDFIKMPFVCERLTYCMTLPLFCEDSAFACTYLYDIIIVLQKRSHFYFQVGDEHTESDDHYETGMDSEVCYFYMPFLACLQASDCITSGGKVTAGEKTFSREQLPRASPECPLLVSLFPSEMSALCLHSKWGWRIGWRPPG